MSKRSVIDQLDAAVSEVLANPRARLAGVDAEVTALAGIAAELRNLPRSEFKKKLKKDLERTKSMATAVEPVTTISTFAIPRLTVKDVASAIAFYEKAFGASEIFRFNIEGRAEHAEVKIGDSAIMLSIEWPDGGRLSAETLGQSPVELRLQVEDVDSFAKRAVAAGMRVARPIGDQFYGTREGHFVDPFGYTWNIFTPREQLSTEEVYRRFEAIRPSYEAKPEISIPRGFRTVTPYLVAPDGPALVEFVKQVFGAEEKFRATGSAGGLHAEVRIGDSMLMMGGGIPGREFRFTPNVHALHVYVQDADAVYRKALAAGATSLDELRDQEYGERSGSIKDPAGNFWYIATHKGESYVPKGLYNVNPYLHPLRAEPFISFLKRAFGAQEIAKYASPDGVVHHAQVRVGSSVIEMGESQGKYPFMPATFYMYVPAVDAVFRRAVAAGAVVLSEPADQPYGDRTATVKDAFGMTWNIATHIKDVAQ
ncbi:MAG TPA: VOC family protein [Terriglobales bacterium]|nr:VOC family protein [Terriglobales bacterium]